MPISSVFCLVGLWYQLVTIGIGCELGINSEDPVNILENGFEQTLFSLGLNIVSYQENKNYKQIPLSSSLRYQLCHVS